METIDYRLIFFIKILGTLKVIFFIMFLYFIFRTIVHLFFLTDKPITYITRIKKALLFAVIFAVIFMAIPSKKDMITFYIFKTKSKISDYNISKKYVEDILSIINKGM